MLIIVIFPSSPPCRDGNIQDAVMNPILGNKQTTCVVVLIGGLVGTKDNWVFN